MGDDKITESIEKTVTEEDDGVKVEETRTSGAEEHKD